MEIGVRDAWKAVIFRFRPSSAPTNTLEFPHFCLTFRLFRSPFSNFQSQFLPQTDHFQGSNWSLSGVKLTTSGIAPPQNGRKTRIFHPGNTLEVCPKQAFSRVSDSKTRGKSCFLRNIKLMCVNSCFASQFLMALHALKCERGKKFWNDGDFWGSGRPESDDFGLKNYNILTKWRVWNINIC